MLLKQVQLQNPREPLQIRYPDDFTGEKHAGEDSEDLEFYISTEPRFLTNDEIDLVNEFLKKIPYPQKLVPTGCVMVDPDDPLWGFDHDRLDKVEKEQNLPSSRKHPNGGTRQLIERILLIRERGYEGNGLKSLPIGRS
jgi:hypothetical protein